MWKIGKLTFSGILSLFVAISSNAQWVKTNGPFVRSCRIEAVTTCGKSIFAATGQLFRSTDEGKSWKLLRKGLADSRIEKLAAMGTDIYAGAFYGPLQGVFLSTDNGDSWVPVNHGLTSTRIQKLFATEKYIYAGTVKGLFRSSDRGRSWIPAGLSGKGVDDLMITRLASGRLGMFATTYGKGVFRSTDEGETWDPMNTGITIDGLTPDTLTLTVASNEKSSLVVTSAFGTFRSTNEGESWTRISGTGRDFTGRVFALGRTSFLLGGYRFGNPCSGYRFGSSRSTDGGASWLPEPQQPMSGYAWCACSYGTEILVGTTDGTLLRSSDNGESWRMVHRFLGDPVHVTGLATVGDELIVGTWLDGVFHSSDSGSNWNLMSEDLTKNFTYGILARGKEILFGTRDGLWAATRDGTAWDFRPIGPHGRGVAAAAVLGNTLVVSSSTDRGTKFSRSTDDGAHWAETATDAVFDVRALAVMDSVLYVGCMSGYGLSVSTDTGTTWRGISWGDLFTYPCVLTLATNGKAIVAGTFMGVYRSTDRGKNWEEGGDMVAKRWVKDLAFSEDALFACTDSGGVFLSTNVGETWQPVGLGLPNTDISHIAIGEGYVFVGTSRGIWRRPLSEIVK